MYTVSTFRDNLREAFNKAEAGQDVYIERYGKTYMLVEDLPLQTVVIKNRDGTMETANPIRHINLATGIDDYFRKKHEEHQSHVVVVDDPTYTDPEQPA